MFFSRLVNILIVIKLIRFLFEETKKITFLLKIISLLSNIYKFSLNGFLFNAGLNGLYNFKMLRYLIRLSLYNLLLINSPLHSV